MERNFAEEMEERQQGMLPGELGLEWSNVSEGSVSGCFTVAQRHLAPNGYLHAASVIALVDTACGYGCIASLPDGASSFTTIELKANYLGTAKAGETVTCEARLVHGGRSTQVWDAEATNESTGRKIALFRCTQMIIYRR